MSFLKAVEAQRMVALAQHPYDVARAISSREFRPTTEKAPNGIEQRESEPEHSVLPWAIFWSQDYQVIPDLPVNASHHGLEGRHLRLICPAEHL